MQFLVKLFTASILLMLSTSLLAQDRISLAVNEWPPYVSPKLEGDGPVAQLVRDAFAECDTATDIQWLPWVRALRKTAKAELNATFPWYKSEQREQDFLFSDSLLTEPTVIFHNKELNFDWSSLADLQDYQVGANTGYFYTEAFAKAEANNTLNVTRVDTEQQLIQMLLLGRLDIIIMSKAPGKAFIQQAEAESIVQAHPKAFSKKQLHVLFPKADPNSPQRLKDFNLGLRKLKAREQNYLAQF